MPAFTTDEIALTITMGRGSRITMPIDALVCVIEREEDKIDMRRGIRFALEDGRYCFYNRHTFVKYTEYEWKELVMFVTDISPPPVNDDICTLCDRYVVHNIHKGCKKRKLKMDLFSSTVFGEKIIRTFMFMLMDASPADEEELTTIMARFQRSDLVKAFGADQETLFRYTTPNHPNENILKYDDHFRNFKCLVVPFVKERFRHCPPRRHTEDKPTYSSIGTLSDNQLLEILDQSEVDPPIMNLNLHRKLIDA